ncbi:MAG: hypothetical protein GX557_01060 [Chloroflexi bacterium]|nr:hypothetical protein [Chloroflexota bacterium]
MDAMTRDPININTASAQELRSILPGTDEELAARIIAYRDAHGPFGNLNELGNVEGIDPGWLDERGALLSLGVPEYRDVELIPTVDAAVEEAGAAVEEPEDMLTDAVESMTEEASRELEAGPEEVAELAETEQAAELQAEAQETTRFVVEEAEAALPASDEPVVEAAAESVEETTETAAEVAAQVTEWAPEAGPAEPELRYEPLVGSEPEPDEARAPEEPPVGWGAEPQEQPSTEEEPSQAIGGLSDELPDLAVVMEQSRDLEEGTMGEAVSVAPGVGARPIDATAGVQAKPVEPQVAAKAQPERVRARLGFWRSALLVLLGALGGALLTLVSLGLISGTLSFTPRREYNALNRNVDTMQRNQELTWDRVDEATARAEALERELERLSTIEGRLGTVEGSLDSTAATLEMLKAEAATLAQDVADTLQSVDQLGERVGSAEDGLSIVRLSLDEVQKGAQSLQERITRFDAFFKALRDLLVDLDVPAEPVAVE